MMIFFAIHFLLEPQVYIFIYKPLTWLVFSYILPAKERQFQTLYQTWNKSAIF